MVIFGFLLFGPDKLPQMGRTLGRALRQFRETQERYDLGRSVRGCGRTPVAAAAGWPVRPKKSAAEAQASDDDLDADLADGTEAAPRRKETFAERRARLAAEKAQKEQEGGEPGAAASEPAADSVPAVEPEPEEKPAPRPRQVSTNRGPLCAPPAQAPRVEAASDADADAASVAVEEGEMRELNAHRTRPHAAVRPSRRTAPPSHHRGRFGARRIFRDVLRHARRDRYPARPHPRVRRQVLCHDEALGGFSVRFSIAFKLALVMCCPMNYNLAGPCVLPARRLSPTSAAGSSPPSSAPPPCSFWACCSAISWSLRPAFGFLIGETRGGIGAQALPELLVDYINTEDPAHGTRLRCGIQASAYRVLPCGVPYRSVCEVP